MIWLNIYIIGIIGSFIILVVGDALTNREVNSFYHLVLYSVLWPFYWVYFLINSILEDRV